MPTDFPLLTKPYGMRRILRVDVGRVMRGDLKTERVLESGHIQHAFEIPWRALDRAERSALDDFFRSCRGRYLGDIVFTDPWDSVSYTCRLDMDELELEEAEPTRWGASIRLVEVADFKALKSPVTVFPALATGAVVELPYRMRRSYRTVLERQRDGTERRYEDYQSSSGIQRWEVGGDNLSDLEAGALLDAWEGNQGPYRAFSSFTEPETGAVYTKTHFVETQVDHVLNAYNSNRIRLTLEELK
jgi:hypothetical protein